MNLLAYWLLAIKAARKVVDYVRGLQLLRRRRKSRWKKGFIFHLANKNLLISTRKGWILPEGFITLGRRDALSFVVPTATLFGSGPRRMKTPNELVQSV